MVRTRTLVIGAVIAAVVGAVVFSTKTIAAVRVRGGNVRVDGIDVKRQGGGLYRWGGFQAVSGGVTPINVARLINPNGSDGPLVNGPLKGVTGISDVFTTPPAPLTVEFLDPHGNVVETYAVAGGAQGAQTGFTGSFVVTP